MLCSIGYNSQGDRPDGVFGRDKGQRTEFLVGTAAVFDRRLQTAEQQKGVAFYLLQVV